MSFFDAFESHCLFQFTRGLALLLIFGLLVGIVIGAVLVSGTLSGTPAATVSPQEVIDRITPAVHVELAPPTVAATPAPPQDADLLPGIKMPFVLQKHFSTPSHLRVLRAWLTQVPAERSQEFLDEMAAAVAEAAHQKLDTTEALDQFNTLKQEKLAAQAAAQEAAAAEWQKRRLYYAGAAAAAVVLIALCSLILVLLAIERNTRRVTL